MSSGVLPPCGPLCEGEIITTDVELLWLWLESLIVSGKSNEPGCRQVCSSQPGREGGGRKKRK